MSPESREKIKSDTLQLQFDSGHLFRYADINEAPKKKIIYIDFKHKTGKEIKLGSYDTELKTTKQQVQCKIPKKENAMNQRQSINEQ